MRLDDADRLAESYESISRALDLSVSVTTSLIRRADALLPHGAGWAALHTPASMLQMHYDLGRDAEDIGWRAAFLRASDAEAFGSGRVGGFVPLRDPEIQKLTLDQLVELVDDDRDIEIPEREIALAELAARSSTDPGFASRTLVAIGEHQIYTLMERAHRLTYSNGATWLNHEMDYGDRPAWDATVTPLSILFTQAMKHEDVPPLMDDLMTQAAFEAAQSSESDRDFDLDPGRATQLLAFVAGTSELSDVVALRTFAMLNASYEHDTSAGQTWFSGGFYGADSPIDPTDHWAIGVKLLADNPLLAARLLDVTPPLPPADTPSLRPRYDMDHDLRNRHNIIDPDMLWDRLLDGRGDAATVSGDVVATYLLSSSNGDAESWARFSNEFGSGDTKYRSDPILEALAFKWAENPLRAVHLGNDNQHGLRAADQFLTGLFNSDQAFATVTLASQITTRDITVASAKDEIVDDKQIQRLWEAYGIALNESDRSDHAASLSLIEKAGKLAWSTAIEAVPGAKAAGVSFKAFNELGKWAIEQGFDEIPTSGSTTPSPIDAVLSFTRVDFHSSGPLDWTVASALIADPDTRAEFPLAIELLKDHLTTDHTLNLPPAGASRVEESDYAEWFDQTFYGSVPQDGRNHMPGDISGDGSLSDAELELNRLGTQIDEKTTIALSFLFDSVQTSDALG
ncbi:MAG: hypothetical protein HKN91_12580 [Acidimicrobiia bacterium]|nr:hypothetical protein [Acidimicrobiia bacterium]